MAPLFPKEKLDITGQPGILQTEWWLLSPPGVFSPEGRLEREERRHSSGQGHYVSTRKIVGRKLKVLRKMKFGDYQ